MSDQQQAAWAKAQDDATLRAEIAELGPAADDPLRRKAATATARVYGAELRGRQERRVAAALAAGQQ